VKRNVGALDRLARAAAAVAALGGALAAPLPLAVRVIALGGAGVYFAATAAFGRCLCYNLMGTSTCTVDRPPGSR